MTRAILLAALALPALAATWADRAEYDLVLAIRSEGTAQKQIALLDEWKAKYPKSELRQVRRELYLAAYQSVGDSSHMLETVREMLAEQPENPLASYWCIALVPGGKDASPETWKLAESAARRLLGAPPTGAEWQTEKPSTDLLAHRALGWIEWQRGDQAAAAADFTAYLKQQPNAAEISAWYGMSLAAQKKPESIAAALWQLARAGSLKGPGALPDSQKRQLDALAERVYVSYHGDADGLDQLRAAALATPLPPDGFTIESSEVIAARRAEEDLKLHNPQLAAWLSIRKRLESPDGEKYFAETLKPAPLPKLKGAVVSCTPADAPTEVLVGLGNGVTGEVTLKFAAPLSNCAAPGAEIQFEGSADSFTKTPFNLVVLTEESKIEGWPPKPEKK